MRRERTHAYSPTPGRSMLSRNAELPWRALRSHSGESQLELPASAPPHDVRGERASAAMVATSTHVVEETLPTSSFTCMRCILVCIMQCKMCTGRREPLCARALATAGGAGRPCFFELFTAFFIAG